MAGGKRFSSRMFNTVFNTVIVANAVCVIYGVNADVVFLPLYALELLLKLYGYGWQPFIRSKWNMCVVAESERHGL